MLKSKEKQLDTKEETIDQRREQFPFWSSVTKEGKPIKVVIRKNSNNGPKEGAICILEFSHKIKKAKKSCHKENRNYGSSKVQFPNGMNDTRMETSLRTQTC